jgi:hypothetical protein
MAEHQHDAVQPGRQDQGIADPDQRRRVEHNVREAVTEHPMIWRPR